MTNVGTPGHKDHKATGDIKMRSPFSRSKTFNRTFSAIAAAIGIGTQITLPAHLPFVPYEANTGKRRKSKTRVNRAAWKCNEKRPMSDKTIGHRYDILLTVGNKATVKCRRCEKIDTINVRTKPYTQNKKVLAARAEAEKVAA
jgi:hypothetical protein